MGKVKQRFNASGSLSVKQTFLHVGVLQGLSQCLQSTFGFFDGKSYAEVQIISMVTALRFY